METTHDNTLLAAELVAPPGGSDVAAPVVPDSQMSLAVTHDEVLQTTLLLVDDELFNVKAVERHLRRIGYKKVICETDASLVLELMSREQPDLILLDIMMPQVNGLELLRHIRRDPRWQNLPVLILTGDSDPATKQEALEAGATDFLTKPVDAHELVLRLHNVLTAKLFYDHEAKRADELASRVREQTEELAAARHEAELRYMAGKAEIATDVLHNVGNALQSVNTGVNLVANSVRESKLQALQRAIDLLEQYSSTLPQFLTSDERGKVLPVYLVELTASLLDERDKITGELELLTKHLDHINAVVSTQQKYAALCNLTEEVQLSDLLADVEELVGGTFGRYGVQVVTDYGDAPPIQTDRQKLLQVLLNIIKNAVDSIRQIRKSGTGRLGLRFGSSDSQQVFIAVTDNGAGIDQDDMIRIFAHGFTTKRGGHGFGLHSCANIMKELGGSIRVQSEGRGRGATFVLELPFQNGGRSE